MSNYNLFLGLNENQREAVNTIDGTVQCLSVAGSGKTMVLVRRIANMINNGIDPSNILVSTFTKKAAEEMKQRLSKLISKDQIKKITIGTFHSIGYKILKKEYTIANNKLKDMNLINGKPQIWILQEAIKSLDINVDDSYVNVIMSEISKLKNNLVDPLGFLTIKTMTNAEEQDITLAKCYVEYEKIKDERCLIDFDDMIYKLFKLLNSNVEILEKYQNLFKYILVDEAQDCNKSQYQLIKMLSKPNNNVFIVGDDDQSIYSFRNSEPQSFINFKNDYNAKLIKLDTNYRSLPFILRAANNLISINENRIVKEMKCASKLKGEIVYNKFLNEDKEAEYIINNISKLMEQKHPLQEIFILYRTNSQSRALEDACIKNAIPYDICNSISFYERSEIKDIIAYIKFSIYNDDESLLRIINKPSRYLGKSYIDKIKVLAKQNNIKLYDAISRFKDVTYSQRNNINNLIDCLQNVYVATYSLEKNNIINNILNFTGYDKYITKGENDEEDNIKMENLKSLQQAIDKFENITDFIKYVDNMKSTQNKNGVKLMTVHKSKGLEAKTVFLVGMNEDLFPHKKALEAENIEEERRLAYVAITRAKENLFISSTSSFQKNSCCQSRFINESKGIKIMEG